MFKRMLLCHDGSDQAFRALQRGADLAAHLGAEACVLSLVPSGYANPELAASASGTVCLAPDDAARRLQDSVSLLRSRGIAAQGYLARGNAVDQIVAHAARLAVDLIVLGHYPQTSGGFWWTGSQRVSLAERTGCCVLVAVAPPEGGRVIAGLGAMDAT